jgi:predicted small secreted protein
MRTRHTSARCVLLILLSLLCSSCNPVKLALRGMAVHAV